MFGVLYVDYYIVLHFVLLCEWFCVILCAALTFAFWCYRCGISIRTMRLTSTIRRWMISIRFCAFLCANICLVDFETAQDQFKKVLFFFKFYHSENFIHRRNAGLRGPVTVGRGRGLSHARAPPLSLFFQISRSPGAAAPRFHPSTRPWPDQYLLMNGLPLNRWMSCVFFWHLLEYGEKSCNKSFQGIFVAPWYTFGRYSSIRWYKMGPRTWPRGVSVYLYTPIYEGFLFEDFIGQNGDGKYHGEGLKNKNEETIFITQ